MQFYTMSTVWGLMTDRDIISISVLILPQALLPLRHRRPRPLKKSQGLRRVLAVDSAVATPPARLHRLYQPVPVAPLTQKINLSALRSVKHPGQNASNLSTASWRSSSQTLVASRMLVKWRTLRCINRRVSTFIPQVRLV